MAQAAKTPGRLLKQKTKRSLERKGKEKPWNKYPNAMRVFKKQQEALRGSQLPGWRREKQERRATMLQATKAKQDWKFVGGHLRVVLWEELPVS